MERSSEMTAVNKHSDDTNSEEEEEQQPQHQQEQLSHNKQCTQQQENKPHHQRDHMKSTIALCMCMLTQSCLLISVFPYSGYMAIQLVKDANEENAGSYAGLIASSCMAGRALSSYIWGKIADTYGRTFVIKASLILSTICTLLFGFSWSFPAALTFRFMLGLCNGIMGPVKTIVSESAKGNQKLENSRMGLVIGMWGWGFLIFPAMGGALSEPVRQYPHSSLVRDFDNFLSRFPFILPNIVGALLCLTSLIGVIFYVEETLPKKQRRNARFICHDLFCWFCQSFVSILHRVQNLIRDDCDEATLPLNSFDQSRPNIGAYDAIDPCPSNDDDDEKRKPTKPQNDDSSSVSTTTKEDGRKPDSTTEIAPATVSSLLKRKNTRQHLLAYWFFSFVSTTIDEAFPLFCISKDLGLGLSELSIGKILSISGILFASLNYFVFSSMVNQCGLYPSLYIGASLSSPIIFFIPLSIIINKNSSFVVNDDYDQNKETVSWLTTLFLSIVMSWNRIFNLTFFAGITIATNRTVPSSYRATMNGLAMLGGSVAKGLGPIFAGYLVAFSASSGIINPRIGSVVVFSVIGLLGLAVSFFCLFCLKEGSEAEQTCDNGSGNHKQPDVEKIGVESVPLRETQIQSAATT